MNILKIKIIIIFCIFKVNYSIINNIVNGSLVSCAREIFLIHDGERRSFPNLDVFISWGYVNITFYSYYYYYYYYNYYEIF